MKTILLNHTDGFIHTRAWMVLVIGSLFCVAMFAYALNIARAQDATQRQIKQLLASYQPAPKPQTRKISDHQRKDNQDISTAIDELVLPWHSLFKALETASDEGVQVLSVNPSAKTGHVRIHAIVLDTDSMMRYLNNLSQQPSLKQVRIVSHEVIDLNGQPAVDLIAEAVWKS